MGSGGEDPMTSFNSPIAFIALILAAVVAVAVVAYMERDQ